jgi:aspartate-semialdehyde dehydrogenase
MSRIPVAVMGATGMVGQRFVALLGDHPNMELVALLASERREGRRYSETVDWLVDAPLPQEAGEMKLTTLDEDISDLGARIVFSALPADRAVDIEDRLAKDGIGVFSNVKVNRMKDDVPILIPEVNPEHLALVDVQRRSGTKGFIVTNANCAATGLAMGLSPLRRFGLRKVVVSTYQALSGAGHPGVASLEGIGNVIPFIHEEEEKIIEETGKVLGTLEGDRVSPHPAKVFPSCARVPVRDGHLEKVWVEMDETDLVKVADAIMEFKGLPQRLRLPSAPEVPLILHTRNNRPQPGIDVMAGSPDRARGMAVSVGRLRFHENMLGFTLLVHNTIRGAAGGSILNAELAISEGFIK